MATTEAEAFAELLRGLKDRSGRSYGVLAGRLHVSTSTLHRYCNGDAVPTDYASVERLARLCGANAEELVELHRRWILADEARRRARSAPSVSPPPVPAGPDSGTDGDGDGVDGDGDGKAEAPAEIGPAAESGPGRAPGPGRETEHVPVLVPESVHESESVRGPVAGSRVARVARFPGTKRLRLVLAAVAVVAVVVPAVAYGSRAGTSTDDGAVATGVSEAPYQGAEESTSPSASSDGKDKESPSAPPSVSPSRSASPSGTPSARTKPSATGKISSGAVPVSVATRPYAFEDPCSQHYLIDSPPEEVPPPPAEPDAPGWVGALGGVASDSQFIELTVQGTGSETVVLRELNVRIVKSDVPLAWTDYAMGVGCGGGVGTKSFAVNLDAGRPSSVPKAGQRDFPYKVSESDPEVFYISASSKTRDVSWYLELDWASGERHGTIRVDDNGKPFRTSGGGGASVVQLPAGRVGVGEAP
ncbi:helix-turn-helix domain-containing protein [Streptomyces sp. NPDC056835]|uniref:helix-turn-helix domain-containing protein n=1 Tax=Streptomyces sp. NPDC056835 TaxID=3345956 RepID=UPI0036D1E233